MAVQLIEPRGASRSTVPGIVIDKGQRSTQLWEVGLLPTTIHGFEPPVISFSSSDGPYRSARTISKYLLKSEDIICLLTFSEEETRTVKFSQGTLERTGVQRPANALSVRLPGASSVILEAFVGVRAPLHDVFASIDAQLHSLGVRNEIDISGNVLRAAERALEQTGNADRGENVEVWARRLATEASEFND